jgi:tRNA-specific 2-thiouridylase
MKNDSSGAACKGRALVAMSGGVDSSVALALLADEGWECLGATMALFSADTQPVTVSASISGEKSCCSLSDVNDARAVAFRMGVPHYVLNMKEAFADEVIRRFVSVYDAGGTPNPCIDCNRYIKFQRLLHRAFELECAIMATGHYARIERDNSGRFLLRRAVDPKKDQSYFLYTLTQAQLAHVRFPLGGLTKDEVRAIARQRGFVNAAKRDSQDICFVPDGDYGRFLADYKGHPLKRGNIINTNGRVIGRHRGYACYTIGQRRGLGVSGGIPLYVTAKSPERNTITLGPEQDLYTTTLTANDINLIAFDSIDHPLRVSVKTRYIQNAQLATVEQTAGNAFRVNFNTPQRAVTKGQAVVLYDGDIVLGGGVIDETW